jgi:hypothetical protein
MFLNDKKTNLIAFVLLLIMFFTAFLSMKQDALTFDELAHIPAGYSYLAKQDYRVNPEHPPLIKDIPALPLLFLDLNFPDQRTVWTQKDQAPAWWVQFDLGNEFLYQSNNNPREIIVWSRSAMIALLLLIGWFLFFWARQIGGNLVGLAVLFLFVFSPTFLAHGRLVNTDTGAVLGSLIAIFFWLKFLKTPDWKNVLLAGLGFGLAMVLKFSLILLIPFFGLITFVYILLFTEKLKFLPKKTIVYGTKSLLAGLIGIIFIVWPIYQFHVLNYPLDHQLRDTIADISGHPVPLLKDINLWMTEQQPLRGLAQYLRGVLMASQRTMWGNTAIFMGEISADSWLLYFPLLYILKIPLAFHFLLIISLIALAWKIKQLVKKRNFINLLKNNFVLVSFFLWLIVYWSATLFGNLNIGIRHLLPVFPFTYIIVVLLITKLVCSITKPKIKKLLTVFIFLLFGWYAVSSLASFPHYIPYYNELAGGTKQGHKIALDSNYDWGQDFYRLLDFVEENEINEIYVDYFGGENPQYWLKEKYLVLKPKEIEQPVKGWVAVSLNQLMGGLAKPVENFDQETGYYNWLKDKQPVAIAGHSIYIYYLD